MATPLAQLVQDPDFQKLAPDQQKQLLSDNFPDFSQLSGGDQDSFLKDYQGSKPQVLDLPKAGQPPKVPGLTGPSKMEEAFAPLGQTASAVKKLASGSRGEKFQAASDIIRGFAPTREDLPFALPAAAVVGAGGTAGGIIGGALGGKGARAVTQISGGGSGAQNLAEDAGNLVGGAAGGALGSRVPGLSAALQNLKTFTSGAASYRPSPSGALIRGALVPAAETAGHFLGLPPGVASAADAATMLPGMIKAGMKAVRGANGEITYIPGPKGGTTESTIGRVISYPQGEGPFGSTAAPPRPDPSPTTPSQAKTSIKLQKDSLINTMTPDRAKEIFSELEGQPARGDLSEMGFGNNPPSGPPPILNINKKTNQALKATRVANELYTAGVPKDAAMALRGAPEEVQNQFWSDLEEGYRNPKTKKIPDNRIHSGETRNLILDNLLKLHQDAGTQTPSSPIPKP